MPKITSLKPQKNNPLIKDTLVGKLMERVYRLFSIRARTEKEVRDYFRIKSQQSRIKGKGQVSDSKVELIIEKLKQKGMLNDEGFARSWIESRRRSKNKSNRALMAELLQKGVDRYLVVQILTEPLLGSIQKDLAEKALQKKMRIWKNLPEIKLRKKAYGFLLRAGFEYSIAKEVLEEKIKNI